MSTGEAPSAVWRRLMTARSADEEHRVSTALELFFDLCFVAAVAQASAGLHHRVSDGHPWQGVSGYALVFFAIWWAWMNFTWFASAYDTDDVLYRVTVLVQISGALVLAAGVPRALDRQDFAVVTWGYVVMRLALVAQWLRAARSDPPRRACCLRYAVGVTLVQAGWVARLALPQQWSTASFVLLAAAELAVPAWAERVGPTTWHPHHIAERYGLFTLIVLGETVTSSTLAVQSALDGSAAAGGLAATAAGGLLTVFGLWWIYFAEDAPRLLTSLRASLAWGYGHYGVFAAAAAVGAGLAVQVDRLAGGAHVGDRAAAAAFTVPVAAFVVLVWALHLRRGSGRARGAAALPPAAAAGVLAAGFTGQPVLYTGLVVAALVVARLLVQDGGPRAAGPDGGAPAMP
ncbi:low temperature requirement protein A [Streptacidiphilus sp. ASG 303]|uniref:low temperature requirement protein A n=1 Tax=Streptacidiphilus sp. ASG 303 TaxID=2896847 RepID=UPI001E5443DA|nr:low temperature requirement protein A [Streptacidiphilus sp. ASG 303]MCD0484189.1 low temperature requirement protein A [Streptacidiphilus sp. ASG 303]